MQSREHCYSLTVQAIQRAIEEGATANNSTQQQHSPSNTEDTAADSASTRIHEAPTRAEPVETRFKTAVLKQHKSAEAAFEAFKASDTDGITSKGFLKALKLLGLLDMPKEARRKFSRKLRKAIAGSAKVITAKAWSKYMSDDDGASQRNESESEANLANLPVEVPSCKTVASVCTRTAG